MNVVWQKDSWFGEACSDNLEKTLLSLKKVLIDELILFEPDLKLISNTNEIKIQNGIKNGNFVIVENYFNIDIGQ